MEAKQTAKKQRSTIDIKKGKSNIDRKKAI